MIFRAYNVVISIMRAELAVPLGLRDDMIAQGMEREALRQQLGERPYGQRGVAAVPPEHPLAQLKRKQAEARVEEDERRSAATELERVKKAQETREARIPSVTITGISLTVAPPVPRPSVAASLAGGAQFIIVGTGFTNEPDQSISVTFDGVEAYSSSVLSPTEIAVVTPAAAADKVSLDSIDVVVTKNLRLPDGTMKEHSSTKLPDGITYL